MKVREVFQRTRQIRIPEKGHPVERTVSKEFLKSLDIDVPIRSIDRTHMTSEDGIFNIAAVDKTPKSLLSERGIKPPSNKEWVFFGIDENQCCWLFSSKPYFLYAAFSYVIDNLLEKDTGNLKHWMREISFAIEKSTFDIFFTQYARLIRHFDRKEYIRECARLGFSHIEVNA